MGRTNREGNETTRNSERNQPEKPYNPLENSPQRQGKGSQRGEAAGRGMIRSGKYWKGEKGHQMEQKGKGAQQKGPLRDMADFCPQTNKVTRGGDSNQTIGGQSGLRTSGDSMGKGRKGDKGERLPQRRSQSKDNNRKRNGHGIITAQWEEEETQTGVEKIKKIKLEIEISLENIEPDGIKRVAREQRLKRELHATSHRLQKYEPARKTATSGSVKKQEEVMGKKAEQQKAPPLEGDREGWRRQEGTECYKHKQSKATQYEGFVLLSNKFAVLREGEPALFGLQTCVQ